MKKLLVGASCLLLLAGCSEQGPKKDTAEKSDSKELKKVTLMLDWTPNTNHTGIYVAKDKGYFKQHGLDVTIKTPGDVTADQLVAANKVQFGISAQEQLTQARTEGTPLKSIGAILQHNTSGFMSLADKNIKSPKDYAGKTYGGWGAPIEEPIIHTLMEKDGAAQQDVKVVNMGNTDFFTASKKNIDFAWVYYGWTGIEAETRGEKVNMQYLVDYDKNLDYYTPIIIANEKYIKSDKATVDAFMAAVQQGYNDAIKDPKASADILMKDVPELKDQKELVYKSQDYLKDKYQDDAKVWGQQDAAIWQNYADFMKKHGVIKTDFKAEDAFTNEFVEGN
ncbi:ABC transporter substrate-binding protein [Macrococcus hajekii]|uniref:ABC transporter substrate-binding protein n=1 Tax=Macrococcus hajekii TaxID=198482 RepID=A0A4R6BMY0_9STAP|nr:ABC transporter substrate-binding protein [Macrococcus hajekii]TDM03131.1 ABC transporter substrate-binding protein [Macrococcus hajekii]GGA96207.1 ABC transporter substrate-binding protein [Macrococcus hajekii]